MESNTNTSGRPGKETGTDWTTVTKKAQKKGPAPIILNCAWCKKDFNFSGKDQKYFQAQGFEPPKKCKDCRDKKKQLFAAKANTNTNV